MWANPGNANFIDVSKNGNWQYINFTASLLGQTVELLLINDQYVPLVSNVYISFIDDTYVPSIDDVYVQSTDDTHLQ